MVRLIESGEPTADGGPFDPGVLEAFTVANARRVAQMLRTQGIDVQRSKVVTSGPKESPVTP
ncbi:hypothetical protein [Burkholderia metallica]|uniref:hypothetical protein n=1 Tax=Burkholderia metallica TaxID=488729 RepID=UPI001CF31526|nr:hypothetical protein [Burkholderia metallica]MCA8023638.1 hypothetical protein [Burkholderia metallica]